jgi:hypothetical protein
MPVTHRFDSNIIIIEMFGEYSINDVRATILSSLADAGGKGELFLLFNFGESRSMYVRSSEDVNTMVNFITSLANRFSNRLAFVSSYELPYGLMRFISVKSGSCGIDSEVFRTYAEARDWLLS